MDKVLIFLQMVTVSRALMSWVNQREQASTNGKMAAFILEPSKMDSSMVKENGKRD